MRLIDLEPQFLKIVSPTIRRYVESIGEAQGVQFLCPKCFAANGGNVGTHSILCWFLGHGVADDVKPGPGRWTPSGTGFDDLTLSPSVLLPNEGGCQWHGWVRNGEVINA